MGFLERQKKPDQPKQGGKYNFEIEDERLSAKLG